MLLIVCAQTFPNRLQAGVLQVVSIYPRASLLQPKVFKPYACRSFQYVHAYLCCSPTPLKHRPAHVLSRPLPSAALPFGALRKLPRHAFSLLTARGAPGGSGFISPKSFSRGSKFLLYLGVHVSGRIFFIPNCPNHSAGRCFRRLVMKKIRR